MFARLFVCSVFFLEMFDGFAMSQSNATQAEFAPQCLKQLISNFVLALSKSCLTNDVL